MDRCKKRQKVNKYSNHRLININSDKKNNKIRILEVLTKLRQLFLIPKMVFSFLFPH